MRGKIKNFSSFYILVPKLHHELHTNLLTSFKKVTIPVLTKVETTMQLEIITYNLAKLRGGDLYNVLRDGRAGFNTSSVIIGS